MVKQKRKMETHQATAEPLDKAAKVEEVNALDNQIVLEKLKKPDLIKYCKELEVKCKDLQESLNILELKNKALQQQEEKFKYCCSDCDFESDCVHCFADHDHETEVENELLLEETIFNCYYCDETFKSKAFVMKHTKESHVDRVMHCLNFLDGNCSFNDRCWFIHDEKMKDSEPTFTCNFCDLKFKTKSKLMNHKKCVHANSVLKCLNDQNCKYGYEKCWFLHTENITETFKIVKNVNSNILKVNQKKDTDKKT